MSQYDAVQMLKSQQADAKQIRDRWQKDIETRDGTIQMLKDIIEAKDVEIGRLIGEIRKLHNKVMGLEDEISEMIDRSTKD